jgi:hypothetical protein
MTIKRASCVEPDEKNLWVVDFSPLKEILKINTVPKSKKFKTRTEALNYEAKKVISILKSI